MISQYITKLQQKTDLTHQQITNIMSEILSGNTNDKQNLAFLSSLSKKGETDEEILGMLDKMLEFSLKMESQNQSRVIDMCGTGGDSLQTFNISTTASFVVAAARGIVAKHGNHSSSGVSGSADIFKYFGYDLEKEPSKIAKDLEKHNICFMFAPKFHPAMRYVSTARKQLGKKTAFNLLGPLTNPARVQNQLVGVFSDDYLERLPNILKMHGAKSIMTVRSNDGMDEFSTSAINKIGILREGVVSTDVVDPEVLGLHKSKITDIQIKTKIDAVKSFVNVLNGTANQAMIETVVLNAAGGLIVAGITNNFSQAVETAMGVIKDGKAFKVLEKFVADTGDISKLKELI